jgi:hypothetical protein
LKIVLAALVLAALALAGSRRVLFARSVPLGARLIFLTGTEFIIVGLLLGESYMGLLDARTLLGLRPFVAVSLGWVGLLFGLQFDARALKTLPASFFRVSVAQGVLTFLAVLAVFFLLFASFPTWFGGSAFFAAATLAAAAACTGQPALAMIQRNFQVKNRELLSFLRYIASLDPLAGIAFFGVATCLFFTPGRIGFPGGGPGRLVFALGIACLLGWMLVSLGWGRTSRSEKLLALLGTCAICGGIAMQIQVSALFIGTISGIIVANSSHIRFRMTEFLAQGEKFLYILLLILAGASLRIPSAWALALGGLFFAARLAAKVASTWLSTRLLCRKMEPSPWSGLGLAAQAGMALAIVVDFHQTVKGPWADRVLTVVVIGIIASELAGPALAMRLFERKAPSGGEVS